MEREDLLRELRGLKVHTKSLQCMGCGRENNCGIHGCRIIREAMELLENDQRHVEALQTAIADLRRNNEALGMDLHAAQMEMEKLASQNPAGMSKAVRREDAKM